MIVAEFRVIPVGAGTSMHEPMRLVERVLQERGLPYEIGAMGTTLEAERAQDVFDVVRECHARLRESSDRLVTEVVLDERLDKPETMGSLKDV